MTLDLVPETIERAAQRYAGRLVEIAPKAVTTETGAVAAPPKHDFQEVDIDSLQQTKPRPVGVEHLGLFALSELGFIGKLALP